MKSGNLIGIDTALMPAVNGGAQNRDAGNGIVPGTSLVSTLGKSEPTGRADKRGAIAYDARKIVNAGLNGRDGFSPNLRAGVRSRANRAAGGGGRVGRVHPMNALRAL